MRIHRLVARQDLPIDLDIAWEFFSNPWNLAVVTPDWLHFEITSNPPTRVYPGLIVTYRVSPLPFFRSQWVTEITHVVEGQLFVDEQRAGPYRFWHHLHRFESIPHGVRVLDVVHYALPLSPLSEPFHALAIRPRLRAIFQFRREVLRARFGTYAPSSESNSVSVVK